MEKKSILWYQAYFLIEIVKCKSKCNFTLFVYKMSSSFQNKMTVNDLKRR